MARVTRVSAADACTRWKRRATKSMALVFEMPSLPSGHAATVFPRCSPACSRAVAYYRRQAARSSLRPGHDAPDAPLVVGAPLLRWVSMRALIRLHGRKHTTRHDAWSRSRPRTVEQVREPLTRVPEALLGQIASRVGPASHAAEFNSTVALSLMRCLLTHGASWSVVLGMWVCRAWCGEVRVVWPWVWRPGEGYIRRLVAVGRSGSDWLTSTTTVHMYGTTGLTTHRSPITTYYSRKYTNMLYMLYMCTTKPVPLHLPRGRGPQKHP